MRIARIVSHDRAGSNTMIHDYTYGENESGFGTAQLNIDESLFVDEQVYLKKDVYATNLYPVRKLNYSTYQQGDVDPAGSLTSNVIYSEVTDHAISETPGNNGKIVYKYKLGRLFEAISFSAPVTNSSDYQNFVPRFVINYNYWNKPLLNEIKYYAYGVNQYSLKKAEHYAYRNSGTIVLAGLKVKPFATTDLGDPTSPKYYDFINSFFRYRDYSIFCDKNLLDEKREVLFSQTDSIVSKTTYQYNTLDQKMGETYYASDNIPVLSKISYPKEMISLNQDPSAIYQGMVAQNMLDVPIQLTKFKNSNQISFSQSNFYQPFTGMYVPDRVMIQQSVTDSLEVKLQYHNYDNRGNVLSFSENGGPKINYLYSYSKQYPVAEIRNTDYEIVEGVLGRANIENFSNLINPDKGAIDAFLSPLRLALPNAFVSTYVYEPSVGMASQTDYKGKTIYYEYDAFQRLDGIKDQDGNIVKKYSYHYDRSGKYYNLTTSRTLTRNNCALGLVSSPVTYTVSAGTYISSVSQQEATNLAENDLNLNAQNYANTYGICSTVYYNSVKSGNFNRNNCVGGQTGTAVTYTVPSNTYSSLLSQTDADAKAQHDIDTNGQAYANANGTCNSYNNVATSGIFFKNNCASGYEPGPSVTYTVPSNTYSSTLSQADADNQAQNDVNTNGQNYANTNGTCVLTQMITVSYSNNNLISGYYVKFHNNSSNQDYTFSISYGSGNFGTIPAGSYDVSVYNPNGSSEVYTFQVGSAEISGSEASFPGVTVGPGSVGVSIN
ncbi:hypothetical protein QFZ20_002213 [Flavobacterium sp. W4I14]|nr:hypothetical protein [Flavobacterium sp. W4I14]